MPGLGGATTTKITSDYNTAQFVLSGGTHPSEGTCGARSGRGFEHVSVSRAEVALSARLIEPRA